MPWQVRDLKTPIKDALTKITCKGEAGRMMQDVAAETRPMGRLTVSTLFVIVMAILGAAHVLVRTSTYGAGIGADSVSYLSTAENLIAGEGLQDFRGAGLLPWPPLFPLLLAAIGLVGIEPLDAGRLVNVASCGLIILVSGLWLRRSLKSPFLAIGAVLALATSYPLGYFSSFILTDAIFVLFTLLALMRMESFSNRKVRWKPLALAALFTALAALTRYAGIAVVVTGVLVLLLYAGGTLAERLNRAAVYGAISAAPVGTVFARNYLLFGDYDRDATRIGQPLLTSLEQAAVLFHEAVMPANVSGWVGTSFLWSFVLAVSAGVAFTCTRRSARERALRHRRTPGASSTSRESARPLAVFSLVYLTFILLVVSWVGNPSGIAMRFLLPLYVSLFLLGAWLFDRLCHIGAHGWRGVAKWTAASLILIVCLGHFGLWARKSLDLTTESLEVGFVGDTFNTVRWDQSETIAYLRANPVDGRVYCNNFGLLHSLLALETGTNVRGQYPTLPEKIKQLADIEDGAYVVWIRHSSSSAYDFDDTNLRALPGLETVAELSDGVIFRTAGGAAKAERNVETYDEQVAVVAAGRWNMA